MFNFKEIEEFLAGHHDGWLFAEAKKQTVARFGRSVHLFAIVELSSYCRRNCHYCGLRRANAGRRYRMSREEIVACARDAVEMGFETLVLQAGEDSFFSAEDIAELIAEIRAASSVAITLCLGEQDRQTLALWKGAGADRYLLKLESTNWQLHNRYRPGCSFASRLQSLRHLQALGYETGSGCIVGLPSPDQDPLALLAADIMFLSKLELHMITAGPFVPHPQTPLGKMAAGSLDLSHRCLALLRLCNPRAHISATSALASLLGPKVVDCQREKALDHGCNVIMEAMPLPGVGRNYQIYPAKVRPPLPISVASVV
ncbi:radical SAM protein [Desulfotalea psychrophila]|uniref:Radical SAM core domain-containing protein n=1 Tax=Desulfotalea psychrophila (strain LSv54 / DSM 12343) TaxID=177439 RepID=Q6AR20_DESPS|nr:radical SAM protein [Desulfotalea psychrophila]CAG35204.1 conserved hypothetical protein [Desulfotalea psychrophila LSv54]